AELCAAPLGTDLRTLVYPDTSSPEAARRLTATAVAQPAIFAVEYALAQLWMSLGVEPRAMIGHSIGEFVAAVLAGVMSLEDALPLVVLRGRLMQELPGGAMLAVRLPEQELRALLPPELSIAALNAPALSVASGPEAAVAALEQLLKARGPVSRRLQTSHAFHSAMVDPIIAPLERRLAQIRLAPPQRPYVSCVSGTWITDQEATSPAYWARHPGGHLAARRRARELGPRTPAGGARAAVAAGDRARMVRAARCGAAAGAAAWLPVRAQAVLDRAARELARNSRTPARRRRRGSRGTRRHPAARPSGRRRWPHRGSERRDCSDSRAALRQCAGLDHERHHLPRDGLRLAVPDTSGAEDPGPDEGQADLPATARRLPHHPGAGRLPSPPCGRRGARGRECPGAVTFCHVRPDAADRGPGTRARASAPHRRAGGTLHTPYRRLQAPDAAAPPGAGGPACGLRLPQ